VIAGGEGRLVEFKQTARWNVHTQQRDAKIELAIAKTIAGFLNADGGTLLIGVADDGSVSGLDEDLSLMKRPDLDRYELWLGDHLERCLGKPALRNIRVSFERIESAQVCRVEVQRSPEPVFLDEPGGKREADMYVRMGNATRKLLTDEALEYARQHWS
jgi:predicted HTH transcriptional regulator